MIKWFLVILLLIFSLAGCGGYKQASEDREAHGGYGYVVISAKSLAGKTLVIDGERTMELSALPLYDEGIERPAVRVEIPLGAHNIKVIESGVVILEDDIEVAGGVTDSYALKDGGDHYHIKYR